MKKKRMSYANQVGSASGSLRSMKRAKARKRTTTPRPRPGGGGKP